MSDETAATTDTAEPSAEAWDALAKATAAAEFESAFQPATGNSADTGSDSGQDSGEQEPPSEVDTLRWLLAERDYRLDNPDANTEAARHRVARREAETQRDAVATQLAAMQRAQIDSNLSAMGLKPAALWAAGTQLADLLGDDGTPDAKKVEEAAAAAKEQLGIVVASPPLGSRSGSGASARLPKRNAWVDAFAPKND